MQKVIFFDLDGTLTPQFTWYDFNLLLGITPEEDTKLFDQYVKGELKYTDWIAEVIRIHKSRASVTKEEIVAFAGSLPLRDDAQEIIKLLQQKGYVIILISGSVDVVVETIAKRLGIQDWLACSTLVFDDQNLLTNITSIGDESDAKLSLVKKYLEAKNIGLENCISIGDGGNELENFKVMKGILFGNNQTLAPFAWKQVETLSEIKNLL